MGNIVEELHSDIKFERFMMLGRVISMMLDVSGNWKSRLTLQIAEKIETIFPSNLGITFAY